MASVGNLAVMLSASSSELDAGLKKAEDNVKAFDANLAKGLEAQASAAEKLKAALIGLGAAAGAKLFVEDAMKTANALTDTLRESKKLGLSFEEMFVVQKFAGAQTEEFTRGLLHMNQVLGHVKHGSEAASTAMLGVGIDPKKLLGLSEYERIRSVLDLFKNTPDEIDRAAMGQELLGKNWREIIGTLQRGSGALDEMNDRVRAFNDLTGLAATAEGWKKQKKEIEEMKVSLEILKVEAEAWLVGNVAGGFQQLMEIFGKGSLWGVAEPVKHEKPADIRADPAAAALAKSQAEFLAEFEKDRTGSHGNIFEKYADNVDTLQKAFKGARLGAEAFNDALNKLDIDMDRSEKNRAKELELSLRTPLEKLRAEIEENQLLLVLGKSSAETAGRRLSQLLSAADKFSQAKFPGLMDVQTSEGAKAAHAAVLQFERGSSNESAQQKLDRVLSQLAAEDRKTAENTAAMLRLMQDGKPLLPANLNGAPMGGI